MYCGYLVQNLDVLNISKIIWHCVVCYYMSIWDFTCNSPNN